MLERKRRLSEIALDQGGYFTAAQARAAGYSHRLHHLHQRSGSWERIGRGIFRLTHFPLPERPDLIRWSLWSRNREGEPQAVVSHESALAIYELSDVLPADTHLIVPSAFRKQAPAGCILHRGSLAAGDWTERDGYRITTPLRTLQDVAAGALSRDFVAQAISQAITQGMISRSKGEEVSSLARAATSPTDPPQRGEAPRNAPPETKATSGCPNDGYASQATHRRKAK